MSAHPQADRPKIRVLWEKKRRSYWNYSTKRLMNIHKMMSMTHSSKTWLLWAPAGPQSCKITNLHCRHLQPRLLVPPPQLASLGTAAETPRRDGVRDFPLERLHLYLGCTNEGVLAWCPGCNHRRAKASPLLWMPRQVRVSTSGDSIRHWAMRGKEGRTQRTKEG